jgi:hypothetical protein
LADQRLYVFLHDAESAPYKTALSVVRWSNKRLTQGYKKS